MTESFRVFSGWDKRQAEAAEVFQYSVEKNCTLRIIDGWDGAVHALKLTSGLDAVQYGYNGEVLLPFNRVGRTDFTYSRFLVPWLCGYAGRAVFFDGCDMLCLGDVAELAALDMQGKPIAVVKHQAEPRLMRGGRARSWSSVMLMDCGKLQVLTPAFVEVVNDSTLMRLDFLKDDQLGELPSEWNQLVNAGEGSFFEMIGKELGMPVPGILHWSHISDPDVGPWIDASGSKLWADWRERWRGAAAA